MADLRAVSLAGLSLTAVLYVAANLLLSDNLPEARLDVTEDRLFTLSPGTHATLDKIDELEEDDFRDAKSIIELLKENLTLWREEEEEHSNQIDDL